MEPKPVSTLIQIGDPHDIAYMKWINAKYIVSLAIHRNGQTDEFWVYATMETGEEFIVYKTENVNQCMDFILKQIAPRMVV